MSADSKTQKMVVVVTQGIDNERASVAWSVANGGVGMGFQVTARGLLCPLPILKTRFSLDKMSSGQVLRVVATDPGSIRDMEAFARQTGNGLLDTVTDHDNKEYTFYLRKA